MKESKISNITLQQEFDLRTCPSCGIAYAVPARFIQEHRESGASWWCPNGHSLSFRLTESQRLRKQLEEYQKLLELSRNRECAVAEALKKTEGARRRLAKRLESGVCPVPGCKRHFTNLQRHIATEHQGTAIPELTATAGSGQKLLQC